MLISTRGRYGVKAVLDLASQTGDVPVSIKAIAERQGLPEAYLEQLMAPLRKAGIVRSVRGAQGGYLLARTPASLTVAQIVEALEGPLEISECTCGGASLDCLEHTLWQRLGQHVREFLESSTLEALLEERKSAESRPLYYI